MSNVSNPEGTSLVQLVRGVPLARLLPVGEEPDATGTVWGNLAAIETALADPSRSIFARAELVQWLFSDLHELDRRGVRKNAPEFVHPVTLDAVQRSIQVARAWLDGPVVPSPAASEGGTPPTGKKSRRKGMSKAEAEIAVREWLRINAPINPSAVTRDGIAAALNCSGGLVSKTTAWIAFEAQRNADKRSRGREVQLNDSMLAVLTKEPSEGERLAQIEALYEESKTEERRDARQTRRRHKDD